MFKSLRIRIGKYNLKTKHAHLSRVRKMMNLKSAKRIGILYSLKDLPGHQVVSDFVTELQQEHKEVRALGFMENRHLIDRFSPRLSYDFFSEKDVNWFYKPVQKRINAFKEEEFDILIDLSLESFLPVQFIAGLSRAHCKVGRYTPENTLYYDLMLEIKPLLPLSGYIAQIKHYLSVINK